MLKCIKAEAIGEFLLSFFGAASGVAEPPPLLLLDPETVGGRKGRGEEAEAEGNNCKKTARCATF